MGEWPMGRREILRTAGIAAGGAALSTAAVSSSARANDVDDDADDSADRARGNRLRGSWLVEATSATHTTRSVGSFAAGGVAIVHDIKPAGPPFTGSWRRTGGHGFRATVLSGFGGGEGGAGPTAEIAIEGTVHGDMIEGSFTFRIFEPVDDEVVEEFSGSFTGTRIRA